MNTKAFMAMASTASGGVGLVAIAFFATRCLNSHEMGFFFSFLSFGSLVQIADFGLSYAALQTAGRLAGTDRLIEIPSIAKYIFRWNFLVSCPFSIAVAVTGWAIFSSPVSGAESATILWSIPWIGYLVSAFANQLTLPGIALREGGGKVLQVWLLRLVQEWIGTGACLLTLYFGARLWSLMAFVLAKAIVATIWLWLGDALKVVSGTPTFSSKRWMSEVWPFQWKIGLSTLSGFLIFRAFSPLILIEKGPVIAGQFGLTFSVMNLLIAVSSAWPMSQAARYSTLIASGRYVELREEFPVMLAASTALSAAAAVLLAIGLWQAQKIGLSFALRLTDPLTTAIVLAAAVVHHIVICMAMFLRAEGREPLLVPSVVGGLITMSAVWLTSRFGSQTDIAVANLLCALCGIPIVLLLHRSRQRQLLATEKENVY